MTIPKTAERTGLLVIQFLAIVFAAVMLGAGAIAVATALGSESVELALPASATLPAGTIGDPDAVGVPRILDGAFSTATVSIADLGAAPRTLVALGAGFAVLTQVAIALAIAYLCWRLYKGNPFVASVTRAVWLAAASLAIGSLLSQALLGFASWTAIDDLRLDAAAFPLELSIDLVPILAGLALLLIASAFEFGERLQRDTEGLV